MKNGLALPSFLSRGVLRGSLLFLCGIASLLLMPTTASAQTTWTVMTTGGSAGTGCNSSTHECDTLYDAINAAQGGGMIDLTGLTGTIELTGALPTIHKGLTITGPGANLLTISGQDKYQIFTILLFAGPVKISKLTLVGAPGGAIDDFSGGNLSIDMCAFVDNLDTVGNGGAIDAGTVTVANSTFSGNSAGGDGGAISASGTVTATNSTFFGNSASGDGGAIYAGNAVTVTNSTFTGNSVGGDGGAIRARNTLTATNNIFSRNSAGAGGAMDYAGSGTPTESYNLFYENHVTGTTTESDANFTLDSTDLSSSTSPSGTNLDPMLLPLGDYGGPTETMMPEVGSAAICAGSASSLPNDITSDQRGFPTTAWSGYCGSATNIDLGSVQTNYLLVTDTSNSSGTEGSLPYEVSLANGQDYADIGFSLRTNPTTIDLCPNGGCIGSAALSLSQGNTVIIGPPDAVTISGGAGERAGAQILSVSGSSTFVSLYGLTLENGSASIGGAIDNSGDLNVAACTFTGNGAFFGGAIASGGTLTVTNSTFYDNNASFGGGGAIGSGGALIVTGSTFTDNSAATGGGAIGSVGTLTVTNNIFSGNSAGTDGAINYEGSGNPNESYNLFNGNTPSSGISGGTGDVTGDPRLAPLDNYGGPTPTLLPKPGSAAICAGTTTLPGTLLLPSTDQRGFPRTTVTGGSPVICIDIGSVETDYQVMTAEQAAVDYVNLLYLEGVLNKGRHNSLVKEMQKANELAGNGKIRGAINKINHFVRKVNHLLSSGVLTYEQASELLGYANVALQSLPSQ